jgi:hypothetical protein
MPPENDKGFKEKIVVKMSFGGNSNPKCIEALELVY